MPLLVLVLVPPGQAATAEQVEPVAAGVVKTTSEELPLEGVDPEALDSLRGELAVAVRSTDDGTLAAAVEAEPGAPGAPQLLTERLDVGDFTLAGVVWTPVGEDAAAVVDVRLREQDRWSDWQRLDVEVDLAEAEAGGAVVGTEPILTDGADGVQVMVSGGVEPLDARLVLVDGGDSPEDAVVGTGDQPLAQAQAQSQSLAAGTAAAPPIITRSGWGADDNKLNGTASIGSTVSAVAVHHTASTNNYTAADAEAQVRGVYAYHTDALRWTDIGYNFLVDRFGQVYEGRKGSIERAVVGAHTGGFNRDTMGVSALGNYETAAVPPAVVTAIGRVAGWKLSQYGVDPSGSVRLTSSGGGTSRYYAGSQVTLPRVFAHRQVGFTACPGINLYDKMGVVREAAAAFTATSAPTVPSRPPFAMTATGSVALAADVDGDGKQELGRFYRGWFAFESGSGVAYAAFGRATDIPVTGDWDGDGTDGIGVFRDGTWYLRDTVSTGLHEKTFRFGAAGDTPVVGRWAGQTTDGLGVVRDKTWYTRKTVSGGASQHSFTFGTATDVPVLGTWLGDGIARPGVVRGSTWYLATSIQRPTPVYTFAFGRPTDDPLVADVDGDGKQTATVSRSPVFHFRATHNRTASVTSREFTG